MTNLDDTTNPLPTPKPALPDRPSNHLKTSKSVDLLYTPPHLMQRNTNMINSPRHVAQNVEAPPLKPSRPQTMNNFEQKTGTLIQLLDGTYLMLNLCKTFWYWHYNRGNGSSQTQCKYIPNSGSLPWSLLATVHYTAWRYKSAKNAPVRNFTYSEREHVDIHDFQTVCRSKSPWPFLRYSWLKGRFIAE